jgi:hypothetical protein
MNGSVELLPDGIRSMPADATTVFCPELLAPPLCFAAGSLQFGRHQPHPSIRHHMQN